jgi:hypothetical protein
MVAWRYYPEYVVPKSTPTINLSSFGGSSGVAFLSIGTPTPLVEVEVDVFSLTEPFIPFRDLSYELVLETEAEVADEMSPLEERVGCGRMPLMEPLDVDRLMDVPWAPTT